MQVRLEYANSILCHFYHASLVGQEDFFIFLQHPGIKLVESALQLLIKRGTWIPFILARGVSPPPHVAEQVPLSSHSVHSSFDFRTKTFSPPSVYPGFLGSLISSEYKVLVKTSSVAVFDWSTSTSAIIGNFVADPDPPHNCTECSIWSKSLDFTQKLWLFSFFS